MAMGKRSSEQQELWVATQDLPKSPGYPFYQELNRILAEAGFDKMVEELLEPYYAKAGHRSIPPGVYFRMFFIGYFDGIGSQGGIAWRCHDSFSLKTFLGFGVTVESPDHSSITYIRKRLPLEVHQRVFLFVLEKPKRKLLKGKKIAVDATTLEADAAMKSIVRKETGEDWKGYLVRLMKEEGIEDPSDEDNDMLSFFRQKLSMRFAQNEIFFTSSSIKGLLGRGIGNRPRDCRDFLWTGLTWHRECSWKSRRRSVSFCDEFVTALFSNGAKGASTYGGDEDRKEDSG